MCQGGRAAIQLKAAAALAVLVRAILVGKGGRQVDTIWDLVKAQPITNRLYEINKASQEAAELQNKAVRTTGQIPPVPITGTAQAEGPAYSVTLSEEGKTASVQYVNGTEPKKAAE